MWKTVIFTKSYDLPLPDLYKYLYPNLQIKLKFKKFKNKINNEFK